MATQEEHIGPGPSQPEPTHSHQDRRLKQLENLLQRRELAARVVHERDAHGLLADNDPAIDALEAIEDDVQQGWGAVYELLSWGAWELSAVAFAILHACSAPLPGCSLCSPSPGTPSPGTGTAGHYRRTA